MEVVYIFCDVIREHTFNDIDGEIIEDRNTHTQNTTRICKECSGGMFRSF
jgi:hypothetical protein